MTSLRAIRFVTVVLLMSGACGTPAVAHERSASYSTWDIDADDAAHHPTERRAHVTVRVSALELTRLPVATGAEEDRARALGAYFTQHVQLGAGEHACTMADGPRALDAPPGRVVYEWRLTCPAVGNLRIYSDLLLDVAPSHLHFVRVRLGKSDARERVLSDGERTWWLDHTSAGAVRPTQGTSLLGYLTLGVAHIMTGYDHLAFLFALLLIQESLVQVTKIVTGFTVAHSITLGLAALGYIRPDPGAIEALIGLSVALVAAENIWLVSGRNRVLPWVITGGLASVAVLARAGIGRVPSLTLAGLAIFSLCYFGLLGRVRRPELLRWAVAFVFGLVHGFGFAAVLLEADLPPARLVQALLGFNLGVEAGQLVAVVLVWPLLSLAGRSGRRRPILEAGSAIVCGLGLFWFVARSYR